MVAGAFDFLHPGHLNLFRQAKAIGDELVVVVGRDSTVEKIKGQTPLFSQLERLEMVSSIRYVDCVVLGNKDNLFRVLSEVRPDVLLLGYDQRVDEVGVKRFLRENDLRTKVLRAKAFEPHKFKSSKLKKLLRV